MEVVRSIYYWLIDLIYEGSKFASFLVQPLVSIGSVNFSLLSFITFTGLSAFLGLAVVKWIIS